MTTMQDQTAARSLAFGKGPVSKSTGTLAATTVPLFTVTGGLVAVTGMWGLVTTSVTVANSYKLQINPTTGDTSDLCAATDIGTTDTLAGTVLGWNGLGNGALVKGAHGFSGPAVIPVGQIEHVSAGTDGVITWYLTWVPFDLGATIVAA